MRVTLLKKCCAWLRVRDSVERSIVLLASILVTALLLVGWFGSDAYQRARMQTEKDKLEAIVQLATAEWRNTMDTVYHLQQLGAVVSRDFIAGSPDAPETLDALRAALRAAPPSIVQVSGINADGHLAWSTTPTVTGGIYLGDREHFRAIAGGLNFFVGRPVTGRVSGKTTLQFSSAVRDPHGSLQSVIVVSMSVEATKQMSMRFSGLGPAVFDIVRDDGFILDRTGGNPSAVGLNTQTPYFRELLRDGRLPPTLLMSSVDGAMRLSAARRLPRYGVSVIIGLDAKPFFAELRRIGALMWTSVASVSGAVILLALTLIYNRRRRILIETDRRYFHLVSEKGALLRLIADQATDMIGLLDEALCYRYVNPAFCTLLGRDEAFFLGLHLTDCVHPDDLPLVMHGLRVLQAGQKAVRLVMRQKTASGGDVLTEAEIVPLAAAAEAGASPYRFLVLARDITASERAKSLLKASEMELAAIATLGPGRLYRMLISSGKVVEFSIPGDAEFLGHPAATFANEASFHGLLSDMDVAARQAAIRACIARGSVRLEYAVQDRNGQTVWLRDEMERAGYLDGRTVIVGYLSDITKERQSRAHSRQLERLATLGEVSASIAHEMNLPLATIGFAAENALALIEERPDVSAGVAKKLALIARQTERLVSVINRIRLFWRGETASDDPADLSQVLEDTQVLLEGRLRQAGVRLIADLPTGLPPIRCDRILLGQVLLNLIVNSCDAYAAWPAGKAGDRFVRVAAKPGVDVVTLTVADQAGGIPMEIRNRVFMPFVTTKGPDKGTGLGLSICHTIVTEMGGTITVSVSGEATTFEIILPTVGGRGQGKPPRPLSVVGEGHLAAKHSA